MSAVRAGRTDRGIARGIERGPAVVDGVLVANRPAGAYRHLTLAAPGIAGKARPGQFVALTVGGDTSALLLRRCFSIHGVASQGPHGETVDVVVDAHGPGTSWIAAMEPGDRTSVIGPLGRSFPLPSLPESCVLVGGGYGSAPLFWLAEKLRAQGCSVQIVLGAATAQRLFGLALARRSADGVTVTTDDGSLGHRGWVSDILPEVLHDSGASVVYACGPMAMLEAVTRIAAAHEAVAQVAVEEAMACGVGVCMTCVIPVRRADGRTRMVRSCLDGPVFRGDLVRWDAFDDGVCRVPGDAVGAPAGGGH